MTERCEVPRKTPRKTPRILLGLLWIFLGVAIAAPPVSILSAGTAQAQLFKRKQAENGDEQPKKRGFFQRLFGIGEKEEVKPEPRSAARRPARSGGAASGGAAAAAPSSRQPEVEKLENARVVLVVGDFTATGLAEGLTEAFAQSPGVRVVGRTNGSSGFVRDDHFDWPGQIGAIIAEEKPAAVIVMIGANDRQQMAVEGSREKPLSEAWNGEYRKRATALAAGARSAGVPLFWMGAPSFKQGAMSTDMIAFNDIYRGVVEQAGGEFIDIWDGFVDENGAFMPVGPDMNGQRVRLRASDGINLTAAGKRKLAFYAERPLNRVLGGAVAPMVAPSLLEGAPVFQPLKPSEIDRTAPIALADPQLDGGATLFGARSRTVAATPPEPTGIAVERLVRQGVQPASQTGRADNFMAGGVPVVAAPPASSPQPLAASPETTGTIPVGGSRGIGE